MSQLYIDFISSCELKKQEKFLLSSLANTIISDISLQAQEVFDMDLCPNCEENSFNQQFGCKNCSYMSNIDDLQFKEENILDDTLKKDRYEKYIFESNGISSYKLIQSNGKIESIKIKFKGKKYIIFIDNYFLNIKKFSYKDFNDPESSIWFKRSFFR